MYGAYMLAAQAPTVLPDDAELAGLWNDVAFPATITTDPPGAEIAIRPYAAHDAAWYGRIEVPQGGWVALRASGPKSPYLGDDYAFAQTTPVYVVRGGRRYLKATDVAFLSDTVRAIWSRVEGSRWRSDAERDAFRAAVDQALAVYEKLRAEAGQ